MTRVIGLTGGIGSGKSTVSQYLAKLGAMVIDADKVGHDTYRPNTETWRELVKTFGNRILAADNTIDRKKLGTIVFSNPEELARLNAIIHPQITGEVKKRIDDYRRKGINIVVLDAPVLFEASAKSLVDEVWVVVAGQENVVKRAAVRTGLTEEQIHARINVQVSNEERAKVANVIIQNDGTKDDLQKKVKELWERLKV